MKKVGSSFKILSGLIVGGIILCLLFKMLSREGFSACVKGGICNTDDDTTCTADEGKTCIVDGSDLSYTLTCTPHANSTKGIWVGSGKLTACQEVLGPSKKKGDKWGVKYVCKSDCLTKVFC